MFINKDIVYCCSDDCTIFMQERGYVREKETDIICNYCERKFDLDIHDTGYVVQTTGGYRNKGYPKYVCSKECESKFNRERKCCRCGCGSDGLIYIENLGHSLCTHYPYNVSCYDKHLGTKTHKSSNEYSDEGIDEGSDSD